MNVCLRYAAVLGLSVLWGLPSLAQGSPTGVAGQIVVPGAVEKIPLVVTGQPYAAVTESETVQTTADGTRFDRKMGRTKTYRDSLGRTRMEQYLTGALANSDPAELAMVLIRDPVAGVEYVLNPREHTARQMAVHLGNAESNGSVVTRVEAQPTNDRHRPKITVDDLGTQVIDSFTVEGRRTTMTFPVNAQGNDRPFDVVTERWFANELEMYVLIKTNDPRSGEHTIKTTIINRSEPDPALFQVPADYAIAKMN
jgi:hypothetical protein